MRPLTTAILSVVALALASCGSAGDAPSASSGALSQPIQSDAATTGQAAKLSQARRDWLALYLESMYAIDDPSTIRIVEVNDVVWEDPCLALADEGMCELEGGSVPGYRVVLDYESEDAYPQAFRMDDSELVGLVLYEGPDGITTWEDMLAQQLRMERAEEWDLELDDVKVLSVTRGVWDDSCLGLGESGPGTGIYESGCFDEFGATAGLRVTISADENTTTYRMLRDGRYSQER